MFHRALKIVTIGIALTGAASASTLSVNFDNVSSGTDANVSTAGTGLSFTYAVSAPKLDQDGAEIPDSDYWQNDVTAPTVTVSDPSLRGYGTAPSGINALDAIDQPVLMHFANPVHLGSFSFVLDKSIFGNIGNSLIYFLDANHQTIGQLGSDQTIPGYTPSNGVSFYGVQDVVLATGAYYDNITLTIPEPGTLPLLALSLVQIGVMMAHKKQAQSKSSQKTHE